MDRKEKQTEGEKLPSVFESMMVSTAVRFNEDIADFSIYPGIYNIKGISSTLSDSGRERFVIRLDEMIGE